MLLRTASGLTVLLAFAASARANDTQLMSDLCFGTCDYSPAAVQDALNRLTPRLPVDTPREVSKALGKGSPVFPLGARVEAVLFNSLRGKQTLGRGVVAGSIVDGNKTHVIVLHATNQQPHLTVRSVGPGVPFEGRFRIDGRSVPGVRRFK